jgi:hypothetical protein
MHGFNTCHAWRNRARRGARVCASVALLLLAIGSEMPADANPATSCAGMKTTSHEGDGAEVRAFFQGKKRTVLTFLGYSGAGYEDSAAMLAQAGRVLDEFTPASTIVNIGATAEGIGVVYELARRKGFSTTGIVSTQAKESGTTLSPCVEHVFFVKDDTWGGYLTGTEQLSPTSAAMVENSDVLVAIGGGDVARDELLAARARGKKIRFIPAEMNHAIAIEKASKKGQKAPTDFKGTTAAVFAAAPVR